MACLVHTTGARRQMNDRKNKTHTHTHSIWRAYLTWRQARVAIVELRNCWKTRNSLQYSRRPFLFSVQIFLYVRWSKATASGKLLGGFLYCNEKYRRTVPGSASNCTKVGLAWWSSAVYWQLQRSRKRMDSRFQCCCLLRTNEPLTMLLIWTCSPNAGAACTPDHQVGRSVFLAAQCCWFFESINDADWLVTSWTGIPVATYSHVVDCLGIGLIGFWNLWVQSPNALIFDPHTSEASYGHADMGSVWSSTVQQWASPVCQSNAYSSLWNCCFEKSIGQQSPLYWPHHTIKWTMSGAALSGVLKWCEPGVGDFVSDEARCSAANPLCRLIITTVCNVPNGTKWYKESLGDCWLSKYPSDPVDNSDRFWTFLFLDIQGSLSTIIQKHSLFDILYKLYRTKLNTKQVAMQLKQVMQKTFNNIKKKRLWV